MGLAGIAGGGLRCESPTGIRIRNTAASTDGLSDECVGTGTRRDNRTPGGERDLHLAPTEFVRTHIPEVGSEGHCAARLFGIRNSAAGTDGLGNNSEGVLTRRFYLSFGSQRDERLASVEVVVVAPCAGTKGDGSPSLVGSGIRSDEAPTSANRLDDDGMGIRTLRYHAATRGSVIGGESKAVGIASAELDVVSGKCVVALKFLTRPRASQPAASADGLKNDAMGTFSACEGGCIAADADLPAIAACVWGGCAAGISTKRDVAGRACRIVRGEPTAASDALGEDTDGGIARGICSARSCCQIAIQRDGHGAPIALATGSTKLHSIGGGHCRVVRQCDVH